MDRVLSYLKTIPGSGNVKLIELGTKLVMLMALANADRASELSALDTSFMHFFSTGVKFIIPGLTKTRRSSPPWKHSTLRLRPAAKIYVQWKL